MTTTSNIDREVWWIDTSAFPNLFWARLRVFPNGSADVFDLDGRLRCFPSEATARLDLLEDEYEPADRIEDDVLAEAGLMRGELVPPSGQDDAELLARMQILRSSCERAG